MRKLALLLLAVGCVGEVDFDKITPDSKLYERDLNFTVNGKQVKGFGVVESQLFYDLQLYLPQDTYVVLFSTCHGDERVMNPPTPLKWQYRPTLFIEKNRRCPLLVKAITKKGREYYGKLFFPTDETLRATVYCNRGSKVFDKVSVCQASASGEARKVQQIVFTEAVEGYSHPDCPELKKSSDYRWEYETTPGYCVYKFISKTNKRRTHRHLSYGFTNYTYEQELE